MSLLFWRKTRDLRDEEVEHTSAIEVNEDNALPVGIYYKSDGSDEAEEVDNNHPLPTRIADAGELVDILANPIRFADRVQITCTAAGDYAAGDVMSNSATDGLGVATYVDNLSRTPGGVATLQTINVKCSEDAVLCSIRLFFFRDMPLAVDTEMDDNAAFDAAKTSKGRQNMLGDGISLNAFADRGTAASASTTTDIHIPLKLGDGNTGAWMVVTTDTAEANETAGMILTFEFFTL